MKKYLNDIYKEELYFCYHGLNNKVSFTINEPMKENILNVNKCIGNRFK